MFFAFCVSFLNKKLKQDGRIGRINKFFYPADRVLKILLPRRHGGHGEKIKM